jgi:hypothetical protein
VRAINHISTVVIVYILTFLTNLPDYDLWARLAVGSIFFQTGTVMKHDIFSYLPTKSVWIDHEWGSGVVFYTFARYLGEYGIFVLKALLIYSIFIMVLKTIKAQGINKPVGVLYCVLLGYALFPGIASLVRSQMFTYLFFIVWLYELECVRLQRKTVRRMLWVFPCTMLFWVNMHGGFLAGIGLVALYAIGELLNRRNALPYLWIALSILPITLINPYGFSLWGHVVEASLMPRPFIPEWHPISLSGPMQVIDGLKVHFLMGYMLFVGMTLATAIRSMVRRERPDWTRIILFAVLLFISVRQQRHVVFLVLAVSALLHDQFDGLLDPLRKVIDGTSLGNFLKKQTAVRRGLGYVLPTAIFICIIPKLSYGMSVDYRRFPVGSLEFIKQNRISGNLATAFDWGSYGFWKLYPQCKVLVDGRYEDVYPDDVFSIAMRFSQKKERWWEALARFHTDVVVLPKNAYTQTDLSLLPDWKPVYQDFVSVVLLPRDKPAGSFAYPDYRNPAYSNEDLSKHIELTTPSR